MIVDMNIAIEIVLSTTTIKQGTNPSTKQNQKEDEVAQLEAEATTQIMRTWINTLTLNHHSTMKIIVGVLNTIMMSHHKEADQLKA